MALLSLSLTSTPTAAMLSSSSSSATSSSGCFAGPAPCRPPQTSAFVVLPPLSFRYNVVSLNRRKSQVVRMAPEDEKMTRRSPLDFPLEWIRPKPGRRPDIFPQFSPMRTPLPPPLPVDPPLEDDEEEEEEEEKKEDDEPEKEEEPETPDGK
ncbi:PREDICTED: uncharacterized protein LOC109190768 [Ipomoea nil]|uniref:uncharacterized protein LOC109190768 n=1 Tax=Ipomoea nil TaxID=35883 RepID=UPI000900D7D0|nr:PREDICTED: uncharacterized protein LOC109190768 [Ipomoea nil]